jgi:hypothetical protein
MHTEEVHPFNDMIDSRNRQATHACAARGHTHAPAAATSGAANSCDPRYMGEWPHAPALHARGGSQPSRPDSMHAHTPSPASGPALCVCHARMVAVRASPEAFWPHRSPQKRPPAGLMRSGDVTAQQHPQPPAKPSHCPAKTRPPPASLHSSGARMRSKGRPALGHLFSCSQRPGGGGRGAEQGPGAGGARRAPLAAGTSPG